MKKVFFLEFSEIQEKFGLKNYQIVFIHTNVFQHLKLNSAFSLETFSGKLFVWNFLFDKQFL
jgi:hypothetical protein